MRVWFGMLGFVSWIVCGTIPQMKRLTLIAGGLIFRLLMFVVIFVGSVAAGTRLFSRCIVFLLLLLGLWSIMWVVKVLHLILRSGLLVLFRRDVGWCMVCGILPFCLGQRAFGMVNGSLLALHLSLRMLGLGHTLLEFGSSGAFLETLHWPVAGADRLLLGKAVSRYRRPGRPISVSAVPFGPGTDIWRSCRFIGALFELCVLCLVVLARSSRVTLVLITAGSGTLGGKSVVMVSHLGPLSFFFFRMSFWFSFDTLLGLLLLFWDASSVLCR